MDAPDLIAKLESEKTKMERILSRFVRRSDAISIHPNDNPIYRQQIDELRDLLADEGLIQYSHQIVGFFNEGIANYLASPSFASVERIIGVLGGVITRLAATVFRNRAQEGRKGRGWRAERRCLPVSFVKQHGIENHEKLAHASDERGLGVLTIGTQPQIESSDGGIAANARYRCHIEDAPDLGASTPDTTAAAHVSIVAVKWRAPGQRGDLFSIKHPQLWQLRISSWNAATLPGCKVYTRIS